MALCSGGDEESKARLHLLERLRKHDNPNLLEHLEAILTELESLTTVAKAVDSGMIKWHGSIPHVIGYASLVAGLIALAPVDNEMVSPIAKGVAVGLTVHPRMKQRLQFETMAKTMSTLKLTLSSDSLDKLLLELAIEWSTMHETEISRLPRWNDDLGKEFRKELQNTWRFICGTVRTNANKSLFEHVQDTCVSLMQQVGLSYTSVLFKRSKPPEAPKKLSIRGALRDLFAKGSLMMFGGKDISLMAMGRKLVGGKPLSPSTVLGKAHAREILQLLMDPESRAALDTYSVAATSSNERWVASKCKALVEIYNTWDQTEERAEIPRPGMDPFFLL